MSEAVEPIALGRHGLPLAGATRAVLRGAWLPAAARNPGLTAPAQAPAPPSPVPAPGRFEGEEPWWEEAAEWVPRDEAPALALPPAAGAAAAAPPAPAAAPEASGPATAAHAAGTAQAVARQLTSPRAGALGAWHSEAPAGIYPPTPMAEPSSPGGNTHADAPERRHDAAAAPQSAASWDRAPGIELPASPARGAAPPAHQPETARPWQAEAAAPVPIAEPGRGRPRHAAGDIGRVAVEGANDPRPEPRAPNRPGATARPPLANPAASASARPPLAVAAASASARQPMGAPGVPGQDRRPLPAPQRAGLLAASSERGPQVHIDRVSVTVQAGVPAVAHQAGATAPQAATTPAAPSSARAYRNPWAGYHVRRD